MRLDVTLKKWISFDAEKSAKDRAGLFRDEEKTPPLSADVERMKVEREKRGIKPRNPND